MRVRVTFTLDVDDDFRRALNAYYGKPGKATRAEVQSWYRSQAESGDDDVAYEYRKSIEAKELRDKWDREDAA